MGSLQPAAQTCGISTGSQHTSSTLPAQFCIAYLGPGKLHTQVSPPAAISDLYVTVPPPLHAWALPPPPLGGLQGGLRLGLEHNCSLGHRLDLGLLL